MSDFRAYFNVDHLAVAVKEASRLTTRGEQLPILTTVKMEVDEAGEGSVTATNLEQTITLDVEAHDVDAPGAVCVPASRLSKTLRRLESALVDVRSDSGTVTLSTSTGRYQQPTYDVASWPNLDVGEVQARLSFDATDIHDVLNRLSFAISQDALRPAMQGALLDVHNDMVAATDGYRLATDTLLCDSSWDSDDIIVPENAVAAVLKAMPADGSMEVQVTESHVIFEADVGRIVTRRIAETYPDWKQVFPDENDKVLTVDREALQSAAERVSLYTSEMNNQVRVQVEGSQLTLDGEHVEARSEATEQVPCEWSGQGSLEIGFNADYLQEVLDALEDESVQFLLSTPNRAAIVQDSTDAQMLLMPVRLAS